MEMVLVKLFLNEGRNVRFPQWYISVTGHGDLDQYCPMELPVMVVTCSVCPIQYSSRKTQMVIENLKCGSCN